MGTAVSVKVRLGVNIDHIATIRNARGGKHPDPVTGAKLAVAAGADGITAHLREDRRHIRDVDIEQLKQHLAVPLNFEMAATQEMIAIAEHIRPNACCLVPEKRDEVTTEGGLNVASAGDRLKKQIDQIKAFGARVSLFIDPTSEAVDASGEMGADIVELHTGELAHAFIQDPEGSAFTTELERIKAAAARADALGIEVHAGHGLTYQTAAWVAAIPQIVELNIGHFLMGEAMMFGMSKAVQTMTEAIASGVHQRV